MENSPRRSVPHVTDKRGARDKSGKDLAPTIKTQLRKKERRLNESNFFVEWQVERRTKKRLIED